MGMVVVYITPYFFVFHACDLLFIMEYYGMCQCGLCDTEVENGWKVTQVVQQDIDGVVYEYHCYKPLIVLVALDVYVYR